MLVLSRRKEDTIIINGNVEIKVLQIKGNLIRLGISAPQDVKVLRGELAPFGRDEFTAEFNVDAGDELKMAEVA